MRTIISLVNGVAGDINRRFATPINFELQEGEHLAVIGLNGSGKSTLIQTVTGQLFLAKENSRSTSVPTHTDTTPKISVM